MEKGKKRKERKKKEGLKQKEQLTDSGFGRVSKITWDKGIL